MKQGYSLRSTQDILAEKGSKHRMNRGAKKRKKGVQRTEKRVRRTEKGVRRTEKGEQKNGCGEEKKVYFGATVNWPCDYLLVRECFLYSSCVGSPRVMSRNQY